MKVCKKRNFDENITNLTLDRALDCIEGLIAYMMLDFAGVEGCNLLADTERNQKFGEQVMPVVHLLCNLKACIREGEITRFIHADVATVLKQTDSSADAGLREAHMLANVD